MKNKFIIILGLSVALIGCGNENKEMYKVDKVEVEQIETKPVQGHDYIDVHEADGADKDKLLGKKQLVMIDGQPIATLIDDYENAYGYTNDKKVPTSKVLTIIRNIQEDHDSALNAYNNGYYEEEGYSEEFCALTWLSEETNVELVSIDIDKYIEEMSNDSSMSIENSMNVKRIVSFNDEIDGVEITLLEFDTLDDALKTFKVLKNDFLETSCNWAQEYSVNDYSFTGVCTAGTTINSDGNVAEDDTVFYTMITRNGCIINMCYTRTSDGSIYKDDFINQFILN